MFGKLLFKGKVLDPIEMMTKTKEEVDVIVEDQKQLISELEKNMKLLSKLTREGSY